MARELDAWKSQASYTADAVATANGGGRAWLLDNLDVVGDLDLDALAGLRGGVVHLGLLVNAGGQPNGALGTLEGLDNIEVSRPRTRLFEAWLQQDFDAGRGSVRAGLYDLNSEFYATEASDQLIHPAFGIGTELSATGSGGPSIFPSTALTVRLAWEDARGRYVQAALVNAKASTLGDPGGVDLRFAEGVLSIVQVGGGRGAARRWAVGAWGYGLERHGSGTPGARGVYGLFERDLDAADVRRTTLFVRGGVSAGRAPVAVSLQAGATRTGVWSSRPASRLSVGFHYAAARGGAGREVGVEAAYADKVAPRVTLQPGLQYVLAPGGRGVAIASLRFIVEAW
ncbi:carbohydrate porin [Caulobacter segnis]